MTRGNNVNVVHDSTVISLLRARMYRNSADTFTNLDEICDRIKDILIRVSDMSRILIQIKIFIRLCF